MVVGGFFSGFTQGGVRLRFLSVAEVVQAMVPKIIPSADTLMLIITATQTFLKICII